MSEIVRLPGATEGPNIWGRGYNDDNNNNCLFHCGLTKKAVDLYALFSRVGD